MRLSAERCISRDGYAYHVRIIGSYVLDRVPGTSIIIMIAKKIRAMQLS